MSIPHLDTLLQRFPALAPCRADIEAVHACLHSLFAEGGKLLLCGNGGSAADADHWSAELLKGFCKTRPLTGEDAAALPGDLAEKLEGALPAIPLTSFPALQSAYGNDRNAAYTFAQLVWGLGRKGDGLVALSTSGNSANVLHAVAVAKARGMRTVGLTGEGGGALRGAVDHCISVPARLTHEVQEYHVPIYHTLCLMLEDAFFGGDAK